MRRTVQRPDRSKLAGAMFMATALLCSVPASAAEEGKPAESPAVERKTFCQKGFALLVNGVLWLPRQQIRYWSTIKDEGLRRMVLVPRDPNEKRRPWNILPKTKYRLSAPVKWVAGTGAGMAFGIWVDGRFEMNAESRLEDLPGADYAAGLYTSNMIAVQSKVLNTVGAATAASELVATLDRHQNELAAWLTTRDWRKLSRFHQLRELGILENDEQAQALNEAALTAIHAATTREDALFAQAVDLEWEALLKSKAPLPLKSPQARTLVSTLFTPPLRIAFERESITGDTYSDLELLARILGVGKPGKNPTDPLRKLAPELGKTSIPVLLKKAIAILENRSMESEN